MTSTTKRLTPEEYFELYGHAIGNKSRTKLEVHVPNCPFLHLVKPANLKGVGDLDQGRAAGLDNCHYCVGGSTR